MPQVKIHNPILPGFNPDPNILRVDKDYYIAVSSFEWMPGIRVYHSQDLVNWEFATDILTTQVDLRGNPQNASIWAPQISYAQGIYYCIYTDVKNAHGPFKDCHNYLTTAPAITGPWSEPIYLNSSGFDPSLFHDVDGKMWVLNEIWDYRYSTSNKSAGIVMQEFDLAHKKLIGKVHKIFNGTELAKTEAPQLYRHNGYYFLLTAEGGTGKGHAVTVCRSKNITGPYGLAPNSPILTARDKPESELQCTGHASIVEGVAGHWYMVYLTSRLLESEYHLLGRETAIQEVQWTDNDWLATSTVGNGPELTPIIETTVPVQQIQHLNFHDQFDRSTLKPEWNSLRILPEDSWIQIHNDPNFLRIYAGESPATTFEHHLLAIRQNSFYFQAETEISFDPQTFNQMAGLLLFLNNERFLYLYITHDEQQGKVLKLMKSVPDNFELFSTTIPLSDETVKLRIDGRGLQGAAYYQTAVNPNWQLVADQIDLRFLSAGFTGNFVGIGVHDMDQKEGCFADFSEFRYTVSSKK